MMSLERCRVCGAQPVLEKFVGEAITYTVHCLLTECNNSTPPMASSNHAIRHWQLAANLAKL